jgi:hypothetical protein
VRVDRFWDEATGFGISKPADWQFLDPKRERSSRKGVSFGNAAADERHRLGDPVLVMFVQHRRACSPLVRIRMMKGEHRPGETAMDATRSLVAYMQQTVPTFDLRHGADEAVIAGHSSGHFEAFFKVEVVSDATVCNVLSRVWVVPRGEDIFVVTMSGPIEDADALNPKFAGILHSTTIRN